MTPIPRVVMLEPSRASPPTKELDVYWGQSQLSCVGGCTISEAVGVEPLGVISCSLKQFSCVLQAAVPDQ